MITEIVHVNVGGKAIVTFTVQLTLKNGVIVSESVPTAIDGAELYDGWQSKFDPGELEIVTAAAGRIAQSRIRYL